jgi:hypothetical protein
MNHLRNRLDTTPAPPVSANQRFPKAYQVHEHFG